MQQKFLRNLRKHLVMWWYGVILPINAVFIDLVTAAPGQFPAVTSNGNNNLGVTFSTDRLDVEILKDPNSVSGSNVITADSIERFAAYRETMPSLWWTQDQLPNKLVLNWLAYPDKKRIDLVVNPQFWNNLEYLERYQLINKYGLTAHKYGYDVRIFNLKFSELKPIVAYTCSPVTTHSVCYIQWQEINQRSLKPSTGK